MFINITFKNGFSVSFKIQHVVTVGSNMIIKRDNGITKNIPTNKIFMSSVCSRPTNEKVVG